MEESVAVARERLNEADIGRELAGVSWSRRGEAIDKVVTRSDFKQAMVFVNQVAELAEAHDHHPDISISWNKVTLHLSTHSAGGLTGLDFELARLIDQLP